MSADYHALSKIRRFDQLIAYLREEMGWPIARDSFEDVDELFYDFTADELGIDAKNAAKIQEIKRLRPLSPRQPWGIFFVKFEPKNLPVIVLRRILNQVALKKRASANSAERTAWAADDLLFVSNYGEGDERQISFAHFSQAETNHDLPTLKVLGWDNRDTALHLNDVAEKLTTSLAWPEDENDTEGWRTRWRAAFTLRHREVVTTSKELSIRLADLARAIRDRIKTALAHENESGPLRKLMKAFQESLVHDLDYNGFADMYAQTIAYGLLSARIANPKRGTGAALHFQMPVTNPFLKELMETFLRVGGGRAKGSRSGIDFDELGVSEVVELLDDANLEAVVMDFGDLKPEEDPVIHFYELFLKEYDNQQKVRRGVFYTPRPVVSYIVRSVHELLRTEFGLKDGIADTTTWGEMAMNHRKMKIPQGVSPDQTFVQILDPATGTGTFLVEVIDLIHKTLTEKWKAQSHGEKKILALWNEYVPKHLLPRLHGYELLMAPYAIAHLKVGLKLYETGYRFCSDERAHIYLTDSLEPASDYNRQLTFEMLSPALAHEAKAVGVIKRERRFTVVIGNPPYLREKERGPHEREERIGGWVRFGDRLSDRAPIFEDFIKPLAETGKGVHAKLAYELSVMFWRMALWLVFERWPGPGIIGMISPRAYLSGPGHFGMRQFLVRTVNQILITDLGGDNRGARKSQNIFDIETGVAIGICVKSPKAQTSTCDVRYTELRGTAQEKLATLQESKSPIDMPWESCSKGPDSLLPSQIGLYSAWPKLADLFPWQHSGSQFKRLWPISGSRAVLEERWRRLLTLRPGNRPRAFVETRDRVVSAAKPGRSSSKKYTGIVNLKLDTPYPTLVRYCYRSLDRQWCIADERVADFLRPSLVGTLGPRQVFAITLMSKQLGTGPAISITSCLPDMDVFCNRGAKDVIPLWRDAAGEEANVNTGGLCSIEKRIGIPVSAENLFCYCSAVLASPTYAERFKSELATPGPRIPIASDSELFAAGAFLGARFIWLQTYGERWLSSQPRPNKLTGSASVIRAISDKPEYYPEEFSYDATSQALTVGDGVICNVRSEVYEYSQSGFKVVESWLRYRMKERGGRARRASTRSELDEIRPQRWEFTEELLELLWAVEGCVDLWPELASFLDLAIAGPQVLAEELPAPKDAERDAPIPQAEESQEALF